MDWMNRGNRPAQSATVSGGAAQAAPVERAGSKDKGKGMRIASVGVIFLAAVLLLAIIAAFIVGGGKGVTSQSKFVDNKQMQAVFLNGGQVYFGNIKCVGIAHNRAHIKVALQVFNGNFKLAPRRI